MGYGDSLARAKLVVQPVGSTRALISKDQSVIVRVAHIPKTLLRFCREKPEPLRRLGTRTKCRPIGMLMDIERFPIVHPGATQIPVVDHKAERMNQVEPRTRQSTHPANITGIGRNLGLKEHDMNHPLIVAGRLRESSALTD